MDPIIELESIYFHYGNEPIPVLNELSFSMHKGDRVALTGANGSGKTTLLHVIMGLWKPQKGMVKIFGSQRNSRRDFLGVRRRIGLLFQDSEDQLFSLTVAEDIAFGPFNLGKNRQEVKKLVTRTLELLGLEGFEERITYKLSGGEKRLVALGTILAMEPEVLLLDEPIAGLDDEHIERLVNVLQNSEHSLIVISHDGDFLKRVTDRTCSVKEGKIEVSCEY